MNETESRTKFRQAAVTAENETKSGPMSNSPGTNLTASAPITSDHPLPPSPALSCSSTSTPASIPLNEDRCEGQQTGTPAPTEPEEQDENDSVLPSTPQTCQQAASEFRDSDSAPNDPPPVALAEASIPESESGWLITEVHSLQPHEEEQDEWPYSDSGPAPDTDEQGEDGAVEESEILTYDPSPNPHPSLQQPQRSQQCSNDGGGPVVDTGQAKLWCVPETTEPQTYPNTRSKTFGPTCQPFLHLRTSTPGGDKHHKLNSQQLFHENTDIDYTSDRIDHNWKPLQITHNLEKVKNRSCASLRLRKDYEAFQFHLSKSATQAANKNICQSEQREREFHYESVHIKSATAPAPLSSPNMDYIIRDDSNDSDALLLDLGSAQESGRNNATGQPSEFQEDDAAENVQADSFHGSASHDGYSSNLMETHNYCMQPPTVEQYLFDFKDLSQFPNIDTDDDTGGDMFELTPTIPPDALPSYNWQPQPSWPSYNSSSTLTTANIITAEPQPAIAATCPLGPYNNVQGLSSSSSATSYGAPTSVSEFGPGTTAQPLSSSKTAVISATVTGSDISGNGKTGTQPPKAWTSDRCDSLQHLDPLTDALVSALGVETHISLSEIHSSGNLHPDQNLCPVSEDGSIAFSSTLLSPPVTPGLEKDSGYLTTDDQEVGFTWSQYDNAVFGSETDGGYTTSSSQVYHCAAASGRGGTGGKGGAHVHYDSHHQPMSSHHGMMTSAGGAHGSNSNNPVPYPFNDLMQLHPSMSTDQDPSVHYVNPTDHQNYPPTSYEQASARTPQTPTGRKRRQGRGRGGSRQRNATTTQIQSDQITSSLQRQQQTQTRATPKRAYRRRSSTTEPKKKTSPKTKSPSGAGPDSKKGEKKNRHNEPLNQKAVSIMTDWYCQNEENPYPTKEEKEHMAAAGGITTMQVKSWFANKRNRSNNTRPKVQKRAMEEKLLQICRKAADHIPDGDNSFIIKELSQFFPKRMSGPMDDDQ